MRLSTLLGSCVLYQVPCICKSSLHAGGTKNDGNEIKSLVIYSIPKGNSQTSVCIWCPPSFKPSVTRNF